MPDKSATKSSLWCNTYIHVLLIALVGLIAYSNSFQVPFIFDDNTSITDNETIQDLANFFSNRSGYDFMPNRFIAYLTFALNFYFGGMNETGYHVVNLMIHVMNAFLVYALARVTLRTPFFSRHPQQAEIQGSGLTGLLAPQMFIPLCASLLFVSHPVQTQAVTYIVQRLTSLATFFFLGSLVLHAQWRIHREAGAPLLSWRVFPAWLFSLFAAVLAMKSKEIAFTLPPLILLYECTFFGRPRIKPLVEMAPVLLTICIIPLTMLTLNKPVGKILSDVSKVTVEGIAFSRWEYLCTQFSVIVTYLRLLIMPINQNLDYDYPVSHSLLEPRAFLSFSLLLVILAGAVWLWHKSSSSGTDSSGTKSPCPELRLAAFGILWFFITLSVESSIIPIADLIFEHRIYLPSVGFLMAAATALYVATEWLGKQLPAAGKLVLPALFAVICVLTVGTYARNNVWQSWETLWQDVKIKSPMKPRAYNNLGTYHSRQKKLDEAINEFQMAIKLEPSYIDALCNLGMLYIITGRDNEAKQIYMTLLKLDPETFRKLAGASGKK